MRESGSRVKRRRQRLKADWCWLMEDVRGRRVLWDVLGKCAVFATTFNPDQAAMNFNEGRRAVGLDLLNAALEANREAYALMLKEDEG